MWRPASRATEVPGSGIREIVHMALDAGEDVQRLEIGEPGYPTPRHVVEAAHELALRGARYTASAGTAPLREAVAAKLARVNGLDVPARQVVVTQGAVQACALTLAALMEPGSEVLVPDPAWPNYEMLVILLGGRPVRYPLRAASGFVPDPAEVAALVTPATAAIVLNTPANPTGATFPAAVVEQLVSVARDRGVVLLSDEVYDELIFDGLPPANAAAYDPDTVVGIYSLSKTYAMTGWRVGYAVAPPWLAPTLEKLQEPLLSCVSDVTQAGALAALTGPQECVAEMREGYRARRDLALELIGREGLRCPTPQGAFYLMLPLSAGVDSRAAAIDLVGRGVAVAPGTSFGDAAADHLRLSLAADPSTITEGIARIAAWHRDTDGGLAPPGAGAAAGAHGRVGG